MAAQAADGVEAADGAPEEKKIQAAPMRPVRVIPKLYAGSVPLAAHGIVSRLVVVDRDTQ